MSKTTQNNAPADAHGVKATEVSPRYCKYCAAPFYSKRQWQVFCCSDHKRAYEKIYIDLVSEIREPIRQAVEKLVTARIENNVN